MKQLDKDQTAFLIDNLFYVLEVNNVPKQRDGNTAKQVIGLGIKLLGLIGINQNSELYDDAHSLMHKVYTSWIITED